MSLHRYPRNALLADYARSAAGVALTGVPMLAADLSLVPGAIVGGLALLFLGYGLRTAVRQFSAVDVSEIGIRTLGPLGSQIPWDELADIQLRFYSTRRSSPAGWMHLKVAGRSGKVAMDSSIEGFEAVVAEVAAAAQRQRLELSETTRENLDNLGALRAPRRRQQA
jgi:hypothetical protein